MYDNIYLYYSFHIHLLKAQIKKKGSVIKDPFLFTKKASNQIAASNQGGKGLAIAGLICSIVGVISQLFFVLGIITFVFGGTSVD